MNFTASLVSILEFLWRLWRSVLHIFLPVSLSVQEVGRVSLPSPVLRFSSQSWLTWDSLPLFQGSNLWQKSMHFHFYTGRGRGERENGRSLLAVEGAELSGSRRAGKGDCYRRKYWHKRVCLIYKGPHLSDKIFEDSEGILALNLFYS